MTDGFMDTVRLFSIILVLLFLDGGAEGNLYCLGSLRTVSESTDKGLLYIFIAAVLLLLLIGLNRVKPLKIKRAKK
ncbi:MAG: hypothetical protein ABH852_01415 [Methanobacteriota archaeon]